MEGRLRLSAREGKGNVKDEDEEAGKMGDDDMVANRDRGDEFQSNGWMRR